MHKPFALAYTMYSFQKGFQELTQEKLKRKQVLLKRSKMSSNGWKRVIYRNSDGLMTGGLVSDRWS